MTSTEGNVEESQIQKFFKNSNVFITGGTGFLGKVLIEKLLRDTQVTTIYILIREKKGVNSHSRLDNIFNDVVFDTMKQKDKKFKNRVEVVNGDCTLSGLGLSIEDRAKLISNINIVFNVAATVNFNEDLKSAYDINVNGTKGVLDLAKHMTKLKSIIHVSTAYSHCHRQNIDEKFYDVPVNHETIESLLEKVSKEEVEKFTPKLMGDWPNTYTFTKALAESYLKEKGNDLPIGIFRPSIVVSTYKEPLEGWIDNVYGPSGTCAGTIAGLVRAQRCNLDAAADIVPVDTCVAALICAAWEVGTKERNRTDEDIPIYNYTACGNSITWKEFICVNKLYAEKYPFSNALQTPLLYTTSHAVIFWFLKLFLHTIPGVFYDAFFLLSGQKPRILQMYQKIHKLNDAICYFSLREWRFTNKNVTNMWNGLNRHDQRLFPFNMDDVHWLTYFDRYVRGLRIYILKDPEETLGRAKTKDRIFKAVNKTLYILFVIVASNVFTCLLGKIWNFVFG